MCHFQSTELSCIFSIQQHKTPQIWKSRSLVTCRISDLPQINASVKHFYSMSTCWSWIPSPVFVPSLPTTSENASNFLTCALNISTLITNSNFLASDYLVCSSSSVGPVADATDVLQPIGLLYSPYPPHLFGRSFVHRQVPPRPQRRERS